MLAALRSTRTGEDAAKKYFAPFQQARGRFTEYFDPDESIVEWVMWLRTLWFASFTDTDEQSKAYMAHPDDWRPKPERRLARPPIDPTKLVQDYTQLTGPLAGTAWDFLPDPLTSFQDYFTEPAIVASASRAMGGIDLDAASHWLANRRLHENGVVVGDYFTVNRCAFENEWLERVWLNPPYGENDKWFRRAMEMMDAGRTCQLCMLSPVHAFTTYVAQEIMGRAAAAVLFSPTPKFENPGDPMATGTNLPHAVIYWGDRREDFLREYAGWGIPFAVAYQDIFDGVAA
jgi:hypothetical protein